MGPATGRGVLVMEREDPLITSEHVQLWGETQQSNLHEF